jgi:GNAT superfamily N-acetyltransferase
VIDAMTDALRVRPATADDVETIADFNERLARETESKRLDPTTLRRGVRAALDDPARARYFLAEIDGRVVGQVMLTFEWSDWRNGEIWWFQSVYVAAEHRRRGVFRRLFEHVRETAEASPEVVGLRLYVEEHNAAARETYRNLGLAEGGYLVMERFSRRDAEPLA